MDENGYRQAEGYRLTPYDARLRPFEVLYTSTQEVVRALGLPDLAVWVDWCAAMEAERAA